MDILDVWMQTPDDLRLSTHEIHVWQMCLNQPVEYIQQLAKVLSPDEHLRAERFYFERDTRRFIISRATLRMILGRYLDSKPEQVQFCYGAYGKPALAPPFDGSRLQFNVSHSDDKAVYAVNCDRNIGIDIEKIRTLPQIESIAKIAFSQREQTLLKALPPQQQQTAFFQGWTRKEAYLKALGDGLHRSPQSIEVTLTPDLPAQLLSIAGEQSDEEWFLQDILSIPGYAVALAVEGEVSQICYWQAVKDGTLRQSGKTDS